MDNAGPPSPPASSLKHRSVAKEPSMSTSNPVFEGEESSPENKAVSAKLGDLDDVEKNSFKDKEADADIPKVVEKLSTYKGVSKALIALGLAIFVSSILLYTGKTISTLSTLHFLGVAGSVFILGLFSWLEIKHRILDATAHPKIVHFRAIRALQVVCIVLFAITLLLAIFGVELACKPWFIYYNPEIGECKCDASRPLLRTEDEPFFSGIDLSNATNVTSIKIANLGDIDIMNGEEVYNFVKGHNVDLLVINGDLTYEGDHEGLHKLLNKVFGADFPVLMTVGNHDTGEFTKYQQYFKERYNLTNRNDLRCIGEIGVNQFCSFKDLGIILSGIGSTCMTDSFLNEQLVEQLTEIDENNVIWRNIYLHKQQHLMQTGDKEDAVGWEAYDVAKSLGAVMYNAHEHSYARTHELSDFGANPGEFVISKEVSSSGGGVMNVGKGFLHVVSNGLGGKNIRDAEKDLVDHPWWARVYNENNGGEFSVHFCEYNYQGDPTSAYCYLENIKGEIVDEYFLKAVDFA